MNFKNWLNVYSLFESLIASEEEELIDRASSGDKAAIGQLVTKWYPRIKELAGMMTKNRPQSTDDVSQNAAVSIFQALGRGVKPKEPDRWMIRIVRNAAISVNRKKSVQTVDDFSTTPSKDDAAFDKMAGEEDLAAVRQSIDSLTPMYQDILKSRYYNDESEQDAIKRLGIPKGTVKSRVNAAKKALEKHLRQKGFGGEES